MTAENPTAPAPGAEAPTAPAQAPATEPVVAPAAPAPAPTPEQDAAQKQMEAQLAIQNVIKSREDKAAAEIAAICEKYGCELIVGHSVKVRFKQP